MFALSYLGITLNVVKRSLIAVFLVEYFKTLLSQIICDHRARTKLTKVQLVLELCSSLVYHQN